MRPVTARPMTPVPSVVVFVPVPLLVIVPSLLKFPVPVILLAPLEVNVTLPVKLAVPENANGPPPVTDESSGRLPLPLIVPAPRVTSAAVPEAAVEVMMVVVVPPCKYIGPLMVNGD